MMNVLSVLVLDLLTCG